MWKGTEQANQPAEKERKGHSHPVAFQGIATCPEMDAAEGYPLVWLRDGEGEEV